MRSTKQSLRPASEEINQATESVVIDRRASRATEALALFVIALTSHFRVLLDWVNALWVARVVRSKSPADHLYVLGITHMLAPNLKLTTHSLLDRVDTSRTDTATFNPFEGL